MVTFGEWKERQVRDADVCGKKVRLDLGKVGVVF
jgi:hypothetical protein